MEKRKPNISRWYALGTAVLLMTVCMLLAVGTTFARYRTDDQKAIIFEPRSPVTVTLGRMVPKAETEAAAETETSGETEAPAEAEEEILVFDSTAPIGWETRADGSALLNFVISNQEQQDEPLEVRVRLLGSLHAWSGEESVILPDPGETAETTETAAQETTEPVLPGGTIVLTDCTPVEEGETQPSYAAHILRIPKNSALYHSFGDGWVFRFLDDQGEELTWTLEEGKLSCVEMNITITGDALEGTSLFQLQIVAEEID